MSTAKGHSGTVTFDGQFVTITRDGFLARAVHGKGEKKIPIRSVSAVQWKEPSALTNGFIQFTILGGTEVTARRGNRTVAAGNDENSVVITKQQGDAMRIVKDEIELALAGPAQQPTSAPVGPPAGWYADKQQPDLMRWWDGQQWTDVTQPKQ